MENVKKRNKIFLVILLIQAVIFILLSSFNLIGEEPKQYLIAGIIITLFVWAIIDVFLQKRIKK